MNALLKAQLFAAVRAGMYVAGTIAASLGHHWPDEATASEIAGALTIIIAFVWSLYDKSAASRKAPKAPQ